MLQRPNVIVNGDPGGGGAAAGVDSFNTRTGAVLPQSGDYTANMISYGAGTVATALAALEAVDPFVHVQSVASDTWTINHNLGFYPDVSVVDSVGDEVVGEVQNPSVNQTVIRFSSAISGIARLD